MLTLKKLDITFLCECDEMADPFIFNCRKIVVFKYLNSKMKNREKKSCYMKNSSLLKLYN